MLNGLYGGGSSGFAGDAVSESDSESEGGEKFSSLGLRFGGEVQNGVVWKNGGDCVDEWDK